MYGQIKKIHKTNRKEHGKRAAKLKAGTFFVVLKERKGTYKKIWIRKVKIKS